MESSVRTFNWISCFTSPSGPAPYLFVVLAVKLGPRIQLAGMACDRRCHVIKIIM